jgi:pSer/pThr/pTyr-binding forkhead associated (FHA) protein
MSAHLVHLVVEHPHALPRLVAVAGPTVTVGRDPDCGIVVDDDQVSREHAVFLVDGDRVAVRDLGSHNGTFVNGAAVVGDIEISDNDLVSIGRARLAVRRQWSASGVGPSAEFDP